MRIWFDLSNSPHINLFAHMIRSLQDEGHEVVITCRPLANTVELLDLHGFTYEIVGEHYGAKLTSKVIGYPVRVLQLHKYLTPHRIDVAVSQSSFHSPVVARMLGVRSIYMNDNEYALGNVPAFLAATQIMVPEFFSAANLRRQMARSDKVTRYPGVKEGIYLWELFKRLEVGGSKRPVGRRPVIYIRPEPWTAQYYRGDRNFLDAVVIGIKGEVDVIVLPRGQGQGRHYRGPQFEGVRVVDTAIDIEDIAPNCDLFIGAGGTMTREMAVLGVPTISVYQDNLLDVDRYLLASGTFIHDPALRAETVLNVLATASRKPPNWLLLDKGRDAYKLIRRVILNDH